MSVKRCKISTKQQILITLIIITFVLLFIYINICGKYGSSPLNIIYIKQSNHSNFSNSYKPVQHDNTDIHNPLKYKYLSILLNDLNDIFNDSKREKNYITSSKIDKFVSRWRSHGKMGFIRLKYYKNELYYTDKRKYSMREYNGMYIYWFYEMINKYKHILDIPWFDIVIWTHDYHWDTFQWENKSEIPIFVGDRKQKHDNKIKLYLIPRSYLKTWITQKYIDMNKHVINHIDTDFFRFDEPYYLYTQNKQNELSFIDKINKAVFYGDIDNNKMRERVSSLCHKYASRNNAYCEIGWSKYHAMHATNRYHNISEEMQYKFQIIIDGYSTRDAFFRQIMYDSVMLKYKSNVHEFWYYDLIHGKHLYLFNNSHEFMKILQKLVNIVNNYQLDLQRNIANSESAKGYKQYITDVIDNKNKFCEQYLNEQSFVSFVIKMINIYNEYFYDINSIKIDSNLDKKVTKKVMSLKEYIKSDLLNLSRS